MPLVRAFPIVLALASISAFGSIALADDSLPRTDALHLATGVVPLDAARSLHKQPQASITEKDPYVLQLDGPLTPQREAALAAAGVRLGQYLPMNAFIVRLPAGYRPPARLGILSFVRWVGAYQKDWKLSPEIGTRMYETQERMELAHQARLRLTVSLFPGANLVDALNQITALPNVVINDAQDSEHGGAIELEMPAEGYRALADVGEVQYVDETGEFRFRNDQSRWVAQTNVSGMTTVWDNGVRGQGQIGGLIDGAVRQAHCSFADPSGNPIGPSHRKFAAYIGSSGSDTHGTHVAGTFVGDEFPINGTTTYRGIAYLAKLVANRSSISTSNVNTLLTQDHNAGARVHSNSWGWDGSQAYAQPSRDIDLFSRSNEESLVLVAVTNANAVVYQPENAKNCIAVALTNRAPSQEGQCFTVGFAPTNDGRRKPELLAPGCNINSSNGSGASCSFTNTISGFPASGTSMACPVVAGCGLLVRQYYMDGYYPTGAAVPTDGFTPSAALVKATLVNAGRDVTGIAGFPSTREGWGRVTLDDALYFTGQPRKLIVLDDVRNAQGLTTGQSRSYTVNVTSGMSLKATLVWTEPAAAVNANPAYINNLNLTVTGPGGTYLGNNFSGGQSSTGGTADIRNNVEQVYLISPTAGSYTVTVTATAVNVGPQGFAAIVAGNVALPPSEPDCTLNGSFDLVLDTACFVDVLLGVNTNPSSKSAVDMNGDTLNDARDIPGYLDCVIDGVGCH